MFLVLSQERHKPEYKLHFHSEHETEAEAWEAVKALRKQGWITYYPTTILVVQGFVALEE